MNKKNELEKLDKELQELYIKRKALRDTFENSQPEQYFKDLWFLEEQMISIITDISRLERMTA